jgi:hypothetical protein
MSILHHLQQVASLLGRHRGKSPIVEDQELDARQGPEKASMAAFAAREPQNAETSPEALLWVWLGFHDRLDEGSGPISGMPEAARTAGGLRPRDHRRI